MIFVISEFTSGNYGVTECESPQMAADFQSMMTLIDRCKRTYRSDDSDLPEMIKIVLAHHIEKRAEEREQVQS